MSIFLVSKNVIEVNEVLDDTSLDNVSELMHLSYNITLNKKCIKGVQSKIYQAKVAFNKNKY